MADPLAEFLGDQELALIKGEFIEPFVKGLLVKGLIDQQDVGTLVEAGSISVRLFLRILAAGKTAQG